MTYTTKYRRKEKFEDYVSQADAARIIGTSKQTVANLVRRGVFTTKEIAGRVLIFRSDAEGYLKKPKGRPNREQTRQSAPASKSHKNIAIGETDKYISQAEAARIRGVSEQAIANLIRRNRLSTKTIAGRVVVFLSEIKAFTPKTTRRPPKTR